ncbi:MAG: acyltransferase [Acidobacteriaceae bacterium]
MNPTPAETTLLAPSPSSLRYMPGLDVVRGIAILMVLFDHGFVADQPLARLHTNIFFRGLGYASHFGHMGVHLFFILSGFLITGVLLDSRTQPDYFHNFYTRRVLRIAPAYLLMVAVLLLTHSITLRYFAACLVCLCNMPTLVGAAREYPALWSLSVEEQFYLIWPLAIRKLSTRSFTILCASIVLLTPLLRFALLYSLVFFHDIRFKTWAVADFFAAGALLALTARLPHLRARMHRSIAPLLLAGVSLFALQHLLPSPTNYVLINLGLATHVEPWLLVFSGFVLLAYLHPGIATGMAARPLIFLAKISYGLYLCHPFLFNLIDKHWPLHSPSTPAFYHQLILRFLVEAALSIAVATLSRYTFEQYFLSRKPRHQHAPRLRSVTPKIA